MKSIGRKIDFWEKVHLRTHLSISLLSYTVATQVQFHFRSAKFLSHAFFGAGPLPIQVAGNFLPRCNKQKKLFCLHFYWLIFCFKVTTYEWCLCFLNLSVLLENVIYVRLHVDGKYQKGDSTRFPISGWESKSQRCEDTNWNFAIKLCDPVNLCNRELSLRTWETPPFR